MLKWLRTIQPAVFFAFCIIFTLYANLVNAESDVSYKITAIDSKLDNGTLQYSITGSTTPVYNVTERFSPFRVVLDLAGTSFGTTVTDDSAQIPSTSFCTLKIEDLEQQTPKIKRFVFELADSHDYKVNKTTNGVTITFSPASASRASSASSPKTNVTTLRNFKVSSTPNSTTISIIANHPLKDFTVDTIGSGANTPARMYIDVDNVGINELLREKKIGTSVDRVRVAPRGKGARIVFDSAGKELFGYTVTETSNGLDVVIDESMSSSKPDTGKSSSASSASGDKTLDELISSSEKLLSQDPQELAASSTNKASKLAEDFSFSGYKKQRISVDFYKIDIHNVFRLFREITDLNIIIDEDVSGSLTLALNDVPWDFALDIILNLMDLRKEEKFNTIVIYPADKEFIWPTRAEDNLSFEADIEVIEEEALIIEKTTSQSKEIMKAKEFMVKAQTLEKMDDYEDAVLFYEKALELWPENAALNNRLASIYLVNLGMNAKALFFAKKAITNSPDNKHAALYAAISSANMQRPAEANEYFLQAISDSPPLKEALQSYASFSENNGQLDAALKLLDKYNEYHGENIDTMIAKARILDKLGLKKDASKQYQSILASGFQLRPDLKKYIQGRIASQGN